MERKTALVLGATGGIGGEVARKLIARGWRVLALHRNPAAVPPIGGIAWIKGDAMNRGEIVSAAQGVAVIVHAVNPPGYRNWRELVLPMLDNSIAAAGASGARILLPGTVYNYGPDVFPLISEGAAQHPVTTKGKIRAEMELRLQAFAASGGGTALIVRAGDFFGPRAANNWFSQGLLKPGAPPQSITYPGQTGVGHQWAYIPDVAETMVQLLQLPGLEPFATYHMEGHWDGDGEQMVRAIQRALGEPHLGVRSMPWLAMRLASPFVPLLRELCEMKYLWDEPVRLVNDRLLRTIGAEPNTPLDQAVRETLMGIGCISSDNRAF
ncbi:NAD-dependent epimerase/dehydratase family protein [Altererythrobacter sp. Root672]|uniref:NAD-dependent epimerase/dehydratase family protein n=1 Tax=Altererythrobacter sp. Root672 TaxID=1736584 RepID=UPI0006F3AD37|nr:NAD-dependent epimerase/dehydratase family protein [Altererythrobacter sp. Root672]KRA84688.1 hypothetical protein ASD76_08705 [Altererythrobacter sp. Root672]